jgi:hypothetical protein
MRSVIIEGIAINDRNSRINWTLEKQSEAFVPDTREYCAQLSRAVLTLHILRFTIAEAKGENALSVLDLIGGEAAHTTAMTAAARAKLPKERAIADLAIRACQPDSSPAAIDNLPRGVMTECLKRFGIDNLSPAVFRTAMLIVEYKIYRIARI